MFPVFIIRSEQFIIHSLSVDMIELKSQNDGNVKQFSFDKKNEKFLNDVLEYQNIALVHGYIEHKNMLYMFVDIIMERLIEV
jgi:hypothetical protein